MSAFNPRSLFGASDQKKALLERLMQQYQQNAGRAAGLGASSPAGTGGAGLPASYTHPFGGLGHLTGPGPGLRADLLDQLGPGGWGRGIAGIESSQAPGSPVQGYGGPGPGHGHFGGPPAPPGPAHPIAANAFPISVGQLQSAASGVSQSGSDVGGPVGSATNPASLLMPTTQAPVVDPRTGALRGTPPPMFFRGVRGSLY